MHREYHKWWSPSLGRDMELLVFGHAGARVLVFPTSLGKFYEWEDRGMMAAQSDAIERGWVQFYCVDSVDKESWYNYGVHPHERAVRHIQYENYVLNEVLPLARAKNGNPFLIVTGASFGAYHAVNFAFRHPDLVNRVLGMSGWYDIKRFTRGYSDDAVYFNNPVDFMQNEHDPYRLAQFRQMDIILATGRDDAGRSNNEHLSNILWSKAIWHAVRLWDGWAHDWPWWKDMVGKYLSGHD